MKLKVPENEIEIPCRSIENVASGYNHKGIAMTKIDVSDEFSLSTTPGVSTYYTKESYSSVMLRMLAEEAELSVPKVVEKIGRFQSFIAAIKADYLATKEWFKNVSK